MVKRVRLFLFVLLLAVFLFSEGKAEARRGAKFRHADRDKDGVVDKKERLIERKRQQKEAMEQKRGVNTWWEKRADTNGDGIVDTNESEAWKKLTRERIDLDGDGVISPKERRLCWRHARSRVNTALEQKYDANGDGWLEPEEVKELLRDKCTLIKTDGQAKVDTPLEEEYDASEDGIIDASEAEAIREDLEEGAE